MSVKQKSESEPKTEPKGVLNSRATAERGLVDGLTFSTFDPILELDEMRNFAATITAKRRTGKSVLLKYLAYLFHKAKWYSNVYVFSLTAHLQKDLFDYVPKENIFVGLNEEKLRELWDKKEEFMKRELAVGKKRTDLPYELIIMDDLIGDAKACRNSKMLNNLYVAARHLNIAVIFLTQHFTAITPTIRNNTDFAVCFALRSATDREAFAEAYLSSYNKRVGLEILRKTTVDVGYQAMVVLNSVNAEDPQKYVRVITAEMDLPKFVMKNVPVSGITWHRSEDWSRDSSTHPRNESPESGIKWVEPIRRKGR